MKPKKIIIGIVGEISSGKGMATGYLMEKYQAANYRFSTALRDILNRVYVEIKRDNMQILSRILRENFGQDLLAQVIAEDVKKETNPLIVIDGVRRFTDIAYLRQLPEFKLIYIVTNLEKRFERLRLRRENEDDAGKTLEQFKIDSQAEAEKEIAAVGQTADYVVDNNGAVADLYRQIDEIINKLN
ncbi:MAG: AAA family ATPase [Patescibacteria group bacterium]